MREDTLDEDAVLAEADVDYEAVFVAADVEDDEFFVAEVVGAGEGFLDFSPVGKVRLLHQLQPYSQGFLRVWVALPECAQGSGSDDVHGNNICHNDLWRGDIGRLVSWGCSGASGDPGCCTVRNSWETLISACFRQADLGERPAPITITYRWTRP